MSVEEYRLPRRDPETPHATTKRMGQNIYPRVLQTLLWNLAAGLLTQQEFVAQKGCYHCYLRWRF